MTGDSITFAEADTDEDESLSESELRALTIAQIKAIAIEKGYEITGRTKAELITAFLAAQEAAGNT